MARTMITGILAKADRQKAGKQRVHASSLPTVNEARVAELGSALSSCSGQESLLRMFGYTAPKLPACSIWREDLPHFFNPTSAELRKNAKVVLEILAKDRRGDARQCHGTDGTRAAVCDRGCWHSSDLCGLRQSRQPQPPQQLLPRTHYASRRLAGPRLLPGLHAPSQTLPASLLPLHFHGLSRQALHLLPQRCRPHSEMLDESGACADSGSGSQPAQGVAAAYAHARLAGIRMARHGQRVRRAEQLAVESTVGIRRG